MSPTIHRVAKWINGLSKGTRIFWSAFFAAIAFYSARLLSESLAEMLTQNFAAYKLAIHAFVVIFIFFLVVLIFRLVTGAIDEINQEQEQQRSTIFDAYVQCDHIASDETIALERAGTQHNSFEEFYGVSKIELQPLIDAVYRTFVAQYGRASTSSDRVDFEVTFMTNSLIDQKITIPASANKDHRQPRSMVLRKNDPTIYDNTVTASLYRLSAPKVRIIEDTSKDNSYSELYAGQKTRINSSIVYPVLSNSNHMLGALVVHCDKPGFFKSEDQKYWTDILEIFARRIAYKMIYITMVCKLATGNKLTISIDASPPI